MKLSRMITAILYFKKLICKNFYSKSFLVNLFVSYLYHFKLSN